MKIIFQILFLSLLSLSGFSQTPNLCGIWYSDQYECPQGVFHHEIFSISQSNSNLVIATKTKGDSCVTTGHTTFYGLFDSSAFKVTIWGGYPKMPNAFPENATLKVIDSTHLLLLARRTDSTNIYKYNDKQLADLQIKPSDYGLCCNCPFSPVLENQKQHYSLIDTSFFPSGKIKSVTYYRQDEKTKTINYGQYGIKT